MRVPRFFGTISTVVMTAMVALPVLAATADLSTSPLVTGTTKTIAPNVFFVLDDSSSMSFEYVPDSVAADATKRCFKNACYNRMYYDPTVTYAPPVQTVNSDGTTTNYANASFTSAKPDGFCTSSCASTVNLRHEISGLFERRQLGAVHHRQQRHGAAGLLLQLQRLRRRADDLRRRQQLHQGVRCPPARRRPPTSPTGTASTARAST